ncbi:MAG: hypothetical protein ACRYGK_05405, partial [Janthinobacterium lividum]
MRGVKEKTPISFAGGIRVLVSTQLMKEVNGMDTITVAPKVNAEQFAQRNKAMVDQLIRDLSAMDDIDRKMFCNSARRMAEHHESDFLRHYRV